MLMKLDSPKVDKTHFSSDHPTLVLMMCLQISPAKTFIVIPMFCHEEMIQSGRKIELKVDQIASTSKAFKD